MKALLLKDIISLKRQGKIFLLLLLFYFAFSVGRHDVGILQGMVVLLCVMMTISSMAYDEAVKWDRYVLSLPVSRKKVVRGKYALGLLMDLGGTLAALLLNLLVCVFTGSAAISEVLLISVVMFCVGLLFLSLILPILFQFGAEKGRMLMMAVIFLPIIIVLILNNAGIGLPDLRWSTQLGFIIPIVTLGLLFLSVFISTKIYRKKEF